MCLLIKKEGILTSLQGLGELGLQRFGINPRGAMDRAAVRILNTLLGNDQADKALELHFPAGEFVFEEDSFLAIGGADFGAELEGVPIPSWRTLHARRSQELRFRTKIFGGRSYLAVRGGLQLTAPDNSQSGSDRGRFETSRLKAGTRLGRFRNVRENLRRIPAWPSPKILPQYVPSPVVRVIRGGEFELLPSDAQKLLVTSSFKLTAESNRMGFRLQGPTLTPDRPVEMVSSAVNFGTVQLLPDGQLVILMADHQTSGGYPRLGNVITSDLPLLAQLSPEDILSFQLTDTLTAERAAAAFDLDLRWLKTGVVLGRYW